MRFPLHLLLCTIFLLSADPFLLTWLCTSLSAGLPRWSFLALLPHSCSKHVWHRFLGCLSLLCGAVHALFLFLSGSSVVGSRSATSYLATALLSARGLHHCIRRPSCGVLEVGHRHLLDLAASHRLGHLCLLLHLWSHCSETLRHLIDKKFPGCLYITWDISLVLEMQILRLFSLRSHALCATERQCLVPKAEIQSCWRDGESSVQIRSFTILMFDLIVLLRDV